MDRTIAPIKIDGIHVRIVITLIPCSVMTLKELEPQLLALSESEKYKLFNFYLKAKPFLGEALKKRLVFAVVVPVS